ncbi:MAG: ABC transporter ATP-binding protein [Deltaproteobacteria bacterium]
MNSPQGAARGGQGRDIHAEAAVNTTNDAALLWRLWGFMRPYRLVFFLTAAMLPLISGLMLLQPWLIKIGIDDYIENGDAAGLSSVGAIFIGALLAEFVLLYVQYYLTMWLAQRSLADLREALFAHLGKLPQSYFDRNPVGRIVTRVTTDVDVLNEAFASGGMTIFMDLLTLSGIVAVMMWIDWRLALVTLAAVPLLLVAIDFFRRRARVTYRLIRERVARINSVLQESISGMSTIQLFAHEEESFRSFDKENSLHRDAYNRSNIYEASLFSVVEVVSSVSGALVIWYGSGQILAGVVAFGTLVAFLEYLQKFFIPIRDFSAKYAVLQSAMAAGERVFALLDEEVTIAAPRDARRASAGDSRRGSLSFKNVNFAYRGDNLVLHDISLEVHPGEMVAVVGASGSGKTTLTKLIGRSFDVGSGSVKVSGIDVRDWDLQALRREVGIVLQDAFLFRGTIGDNVSLGREDTDEAQVRAAIRAANLEAFVDSRPRGLDEKIRERGNNLSVGQRQLLAFARALAYDPQILILDEATSSVDTQTEARIQEALDRLLENRTSIVIAHRLSTIERADRIVVLHHGRIREVGTHQELLDRGEIYARLHALQYARARPVEGSAA